MKTNPEHWLHNDEQHDVHAPADKRQGAKTSALSAPSKACVGIGEANAASKPVRAEDEVLTAQEVAALLRVHPVTVRLGAAAGSIPGTRIGSRWRFSRVAIQALLGSNQKTTAPE